MKIAVRLDDITPDMDWERFLKFKELLDRYQVKPLIGVVPDNHDDMLKGPGNAKDPVWFWEYVRELQKAGWTVAMHGYRHIYSTKKAGIFPLNNFSEFAGLPYEKQLQMLKSGKEILNKNKITSDIFMAPAHSFDQNTIKALKETGFCALTDGFGDAPYLRSGLKFYPISFQLSKTFQKTKGYSTMVVHTGTLSESDFEKYERYFQTEHIQWISYEEYLQQPAKERGMLASMKEYLMAKGKYLIGKIRS